jgi:NAD(P)-dependent dehydrogenase (short-subunit alcohol dehydrogenase family)
MTTGDLLGRTALVTGGGSGIGLHTAKRFARDGASVTICGRTETKLAAALPLIEAEAAPGAQITMAVADVTVEEDVARVVSAAAQPTGRLDILFACAGGAYTVGPIAEAEAEAVRATVDLNLMGSFLCVKHAGRAMAADGSGGSIVLMSSGAGGFPHRLMTAYGMSKAGIESLCTYAAEELGAVGIRVNAVAPGIIDDELMTMITAGGALLDDYLDQMPLRRVGSLDDVADAVSYLAGPASSWVTGVCLAVDGGHHLRRGADYSLL